MQRQLGEFAERMTTFMASKVVSSPTYTSHHSFELMALFILSFSQVEPRCAALGFAASLVEERWHLRDDEQFDLAAWFLSLFNNHRTAKQFRKKILEGAMVPDPIAPPYRALHCAFSR